MGSIVETSANRGSELFVACILVQRHEAAIQQGVMKFHLCFVSSAILPFLCFCADTLCSWNDGSVLSRLLLRKHCRVGTFIRIDFLSPCCCAVHSLRPIQTRLVLRWPCILVAWLKPLHPRHLEVWFFQSCHHTHISSCLDTEIRALLTTQSHHSTNTERDKTLSGCGAK